VNESNFATNFGSFTLTGGLNINTVPPPRYDRNQVRQDLLESMFRAGGPPRNNPLTITFTEPPPADLFFNAQIVAISGATAHVVECVLPGGQSSYSIPQRFFANIPDSSNGFVGSFFARTFAPPRRIVLAPGVEIHSFGESVVSITISR
jgi:hypothetical protein